MRGVVVVACARRQQRGNRARRRADLDPALRAPAAADAPRHRACRSCARWRSAPHRGASMTCSAVSVAKTSTMIVAQLLARRDAPRVGVEARIGGELRLRCSTLSQNMRPLALVLQAEHDRLAVAGRERTVGIDRRVRCAGARRRRRAVERVVERIAHPLDHALEHRHVDAAAACRSCRAASARRGCWCTRTCRRRCRRSSSRPSPARPACR